MDSKAPPSPGVSTSSDGTSLNEIRSSFDSVTAQADALIGSMLDDTSGSQRISTSAAAADADIGVTENNPKNDGEKANSTVATNNNSASNQTSSSSSDGEKDPNWHRRKISWGMDTVMESGAEGIFTPALTGPSEKKAAVNPHTLSPSLKASAFTASPGAAKYMEPRRPLPTPAAAAATQQTEPEEVDDENARQAAYIQNLFAGNPPKRNKDRWGRTRISSLGDVDLADVLKESPMEAEAETYIIQAIEQRDNQFLSILNNDSNTNANTQANSGSGAFPDLPDDAISALSSNQNPTDDEVSGPPETGNHSVANNLSSSAGGTSRSPGSLLQHQQNSKIYRHRRHLTMEQQLDGLASAIDSLQSDHQSHWIPTTPMGTSAGFTDDYEPNSPGANMTTLEEHGSAEALQRNASLLYNNMNNDHSTTRSGGGGRRRRGSRLQSQGGSLRNLFIHHRQESMDTSQMNNQNNIDPDISNKSKRSNHSQANSSQQQKDLHPKKTDGDDFSNHFDGAMEKPQQSTDDSIASSRAPEVLVRWSDVEQGGGADVMIEAAHDTENNDTNNDNGDGGSTNRAASEAERKARRKRREWQSVRELQDFFEPKKTTIALYFRVAFLYIAAPLIGIAAVLFYVADCPPTGRLVNNGQPDANGTLLNTEGDVVDPNQASISWWLIFAVRQMVTFTLAKCAEAVFVDFLTIRARGTINVLGPWLTLFILQSRGWPSTVSIWAIFNFALLFGSSDFTEHWLYWQEYIGLFTAENPSGNVLNSEWNAKILTIALILGMAVSLKRLLLGLYLGKRTFNAYADQLASIMQRILLISEVATLAKSFERELRIRGTQLGVSSSTYAANMSAQRDKLFNTFADLDEDTASVQGQDSAVSMTDRSEGYSKVTQIIDSADRNPWSGLLSYTQQQRIIQLLGQWEEPIIAEKVVENISVSALLQFRRSMACLNTQFPFSAAFGFADTRENCIQSAQELYRRLLLNDPEQSDLSFETLALLGLQSDGSLDQAKLKDIMRLFRPDRDGQFGILDFVKSIDTVYKEIRMLRASVTNSSKIDKSFETILNWLFYAVAITIILGQLGYSPMALFLSISGVILAFAFMIGSASSKYFEGLLFIILRRPYAIGDGIHVMGVESEGMYTGHAFWYVEDVTLFTTSVLYMYTGERATLSNGSLANSRITNASRSPQAWMYILLKFPVDVTHEKLDIFNSALEQFFKNRPREWRSYDSFRAARLDAEAGFIEYMVVATHRNSWYDWTTVHTSKAAMIHFSMELSKQLGIFYRTPPVPVDLSIQNGSFPPAASVAGSVGPECSNPGLPPVAPLRQGSEPLDLTALQSLFRRH